MSRPTLGSDLITLPEGDWQGIVFVSLALTVSESDPPSAVVTLHLNDTYDDTLTPDDVVVTGGRRIRNLKYEVTFPDDKTIKIEFPTIGDHSTYTVELRSGGGRALHPFFAHADFSFTVDCEGSDCRVSPEAAPAQHPPRPALDLVTKDFAGFVRLLADRAQVVDPAWADHAPASLERVFVDLLAHAGDMISYHQDRVANEAFVETATERYSLTQHALLLGVGTRSGEAATTVLGFAVTNDGWVPAGLEVRMAGSTDEAPVVFHCVNRTEVRAARSPKNFVFAGWPGAADATVAAGARSLLFLGHSLPLAEGDRLAVVQGSESQILGVASVEERAEPGWVADPENDPTTTADADVTEVTFAEPLGFALAPWGSPTPVVYANLVEARHGVERIAWASPANPSNVRRTHIVLDLTAHNSTIVTNDRAGGAAYHLRQLKVPEGPVVWSTDAMGTSAPLIEVRVGGEEWTRVEHLHNSRSYDTHYVAEVDNGGGLWLRFGDGVRGREVEVQGVLDPALGRADAAGDVDRIAGRSAEEIRLRWRVGDPLAGNVGIGSLRTVVNPTDPTALTALGGLGNVEVTSVIAATGGVAPDALASIRERIPESIRHGLQERAVTLDDYARVAEDVDGVARAYARAIGGPFNTVVVLVDPKAEEVLSDGLRRRVQDHVDARRMAGREVVVRQADYVPLDVALGLCVELGYQKHAVRARVYAALRPGTARNPGYFHPDRLSFGGDVDLGALLAFVQGIDGVRSVKALTFRRLLQPQTIGKAVYPRIVLAPTEVARLDGDDDYPEAGRLVIRVVGLDVPDENVWTIGAPGGSP